MRTRALSLPSPWKSSRLCFSRPNSRSWSIFLCWVRLYVRLTQNPKPAIKAAIVAPITVPIPPATVIHRCVSGVTALRFCTSVSSFCFSNSSFSTCFKSSCSSRVVRSNSVLAGSSPSAGKPRRPRVDTIDRTTMIPAVLSALCLLDRFVISVAAKIHERERICGLRRRDYSIVSIVQQHRGTII
jgi:hypothetical protein